MATFKSLPIEVFQHICSFLEVPHILALGEVCEQFKHWINDPCHWRVRLMRKWPFHDYPVLEDEPRDWMETCSLREEAFRVWGGHNQQILYHSTSTPGIVQGIDAVHILPPGDLVLVGGRDRYFSIIRRQDLLQNNKNDEIVFEDMFTHKGWIWSITSSGNQVVTGSWDLHARLWTMAEATPQLQTTYKLKSSVLCTSFLDSGSPIVAVGTYGKLIAILDLRCAPSDPPMQNLRKHTGPVLCLRPNDDSEAEVEGPHRSHVLYTVGEDAQLVMWDLRRPDLVVSSCKLSCYARDIAICGGELWLGDKNGGFQLFDIREGDLRPISTRYNRGRTKSIGGIHVDRGCLLAGSLDGWVQAFHPNCQPVPMGPPLVQGLYGGAVCLSYYDKSLAVGTGNGTLHYWAPKPADQVDEATTLT